MKSLLQRISVKKRLYVTQKITQNELTKEFYSNYILNIIATGNTLLCCQIFELAKDIHRWNIYLRFLSNFEAFASELLGNLKQILPTGSGIRMKYCFKILKKCLENLHFSTTCNTLLCDWIIKIVTEITMLVIPRKHIFNDF